MAPQPQPDTELRAKLEAARQAYEYACASVDAREQDAALLAWRAAFDAFVSAVIPRRPAETVMGQQSADGPKPVKNTEGEGNCQ